MNDRQSHDMGTPAERIPYLNVGEVSRLTNISIRMLRHWDETGLVSPQRDWNGYRLYSDSDLSRLRRLLLYRELGIPVPRIKQLLDAKPSELIRELADRRGQLARKAERINQALVDIDRLMDIAQTGIDMNDATRQSCEWAEEAQSRWGGSQQWMQAAEYQVRRTSDMQERDMKQFEAIEQQLADAMRRGVEPGSDEGNELAETHRRSLVWFDVTPSMHVCLGRMYVADERFVQHYDALEPGLAQWLLALIEANATRFGVDLDNVMWQ